MHLPALVAAGDLPQLQHAALVLPGRDRDDHVGVGEVVRAGAAVVPGEGHRGELLAIDGGDLLAGLSFAVGEQAEPGVDDRGEQVRGPAAAVEAQRDIAPVPADGPQIREQVLDLSGQG